MSQNRFEIEGNLKSRSEIDFTDAPLAVLALLGGKEMGFGDVDEQGHYRITFESDEAPASTELRILPAELAERGGTLPALAKTFNASRYVAMNHGERGYHADLDLPMPRDYRESMKRAITETYQFVGNVYTVEGVGVLRRFEPLAGARIDFYEVDWPAVRPLPPSLDPAYEGIATTPETEQLLGRVETEPDGSFDFKFDFSVYYRPPMPPGTDVLPDVRVRIHQFVDGTWHQVHEGVTKWNVGEVMACRFVVPKENTFPVPDAGAKPDIGCDFTSLGLLPIDDNHLVDGYVSALPGDPAKIAGISHQPLCGTLRLFGLFAETPAVANYRVQVAEADATGAIGSWRTLTDALHNRRWNDTESRWEHVILGPDPTTGLYRNVDVEDEDAWQEHALKFTWNTVHETNGYYVLRITGYDANGTELKTDETPVLRVDNDLPSVALEALDAGICGGVALTTNQDTHRGIRFRVIAHDAEGHLLKYGIRATRGMAGDLAFSRQTLRDPATGYWNGTAPGGDVEWLQMAALTPELANCTRALSYNFELTAYGSGTDCYSRTHSAQRDRKEVNLIVSE